MRTSPWSADHRSQTSPGLDPQSRAFGRLKPSRIEPVAIVQRKKAAELVLHRLQPRIAACASEPVRKGLSGFARETGLSQPLFQQIKFRIQARPERSLARVLFFDSALPARAENNLEKQQAEHRHQCPQNVLAQMGLPPTDFCEFETQPRP